ncbi:uncharacterized protein B0J16DRAFT_333453 [Fusarium flagelliforme]|uniref:uncharacterized protein n=1 Tax=Fusarium flagelliforme TaxID=2675880 RepID=UPI001E8D88B6|nr:uncharacterized protein B0J16DRAFT_333453 [Fusarium flagelliforme]KAH7192642.1 hypothetical protein B0J16DRAFT_333453 [Fusarium flagelliforme]
MHCSFLPRFVQYNMFVGSWLLLQSTYSTHTHTLQVGRINFRMHLCRVVGLLRAFAYYSITYTRPVSGFETEIETALRRTRTGG